ncbi:MAG: CPBP family intramembrane glutamic endopeptidase [Pseudomonadota bacterium]
MKSLVFVLTTIACFSITFLIPSLEGYEKFLFIFACSCGALSLLVFKEPIIQFKTIHARWVVYAVIAGVVYACIKLLLKVFLLKHPIEPDPISLIMLLDILLITCLLSPFLEELFFRGVLFDDLRKKWGVIAAITVTSILFLAIHINNYHESRLVESLLLMLPGIMLYVYFKLKTNNFLVSTATHIAHNTTLFIFFTIFW